MNTNLQTEKEFTLPKTQKLRQLVASFTATEWVLFLALSVVATISALILTYHTSRMFMVSIPTHGGTLTEGVTGIPRFINPVLATSDVDRDMTALIYSGLMRYENGNLIPDLAKTYSVSKDNLKYTFVLKDTAVFQDGTPITADDIVFTVNKAQDVNLKSPKRADWADVEVRKTDNKTVEFTLKRPYAPFLQNTTLGILPSHIWSTNITAEQFTFSQFNTEPVGSGPFKLKNIVKDNGGIPTKYVLESFNRYTSGKPYLDNIEIGLYANRESLITAFSNGSIQSIYGVTPAITEQVRKGEIGNAGSRIYETPLPFVMAVFFNQNQAPVLAFKEVRQALDLAVPRDVIVKYVLLGGAKPLYGPLPLTYFDDNSTNNKQVIGKSVNSTNSQTTLASANTNASVTASTSPSQIILEKAGWVMGADGVYTKTVKGTKDPIRLEFSLTTSITNPEFKKVAEAIIASWNNIGARVTLKVFDGDISQNIIRPRKFDSLLFGEVIGPDLDFYGFWHSSQRLAPGLNIAQYTNAKADKILEDARVEQDNTKRMQYYKDFADILKEDVPAVFVYSPNFTYIVSPEIRGVKINTITLPADRWDGVFNWYTATESVWKIFAKTRQ